MWGDENDPYDAAAPSHTKLQVHLVNTRNSLSRKCLNGRWEAVVFGCRKVKEFV